MVCVARILSDKKKARAAGLFLSEKKITDYTAHNAYTCSTKRKHTSRSCRKRNGVAAKEEIEMNKFVK